MSVNAIPARSRDSITFEIAPKLRVLCLLCAFLEDDEHSTAAAAQTIGKCEQRTPYNPRQPSHIDCYVENPPMPEMQ